MSPQPAAPAQPLMTPAAALDLAFAEQNYEVPAGGPNREHLHVQSFEAVEAVDGATYIQVAVSDWPSCVDDEGNGDVGAAREVIYHFRIQYTPVADVPPARTRPTG